MGFKINPHLMKVGISENSTINLLKKLSDIGLPVISCSGLQLPKYCKVPKKVNNILQTQNIDKFERVLPYIKNIPFIFAHSGLEQTDRLIELMKVHKNTYTDISTQPPGSDYPYFNQAFPILSVLRAMEDNIFNDNAKRILKL